MEGRAELFLHLSPGSGERWRTSIVAGGHLVLPHDVFGVVPFAAGNEPARSMPMSAGCWRADNNFGVGGGQLYIVQ